jgi:hypothetical protein
MRLVCLQLPIAAGQGGVDIPPFHAENNRMRLGSAQMHAISVVLLRIALRRTRRSVISH